MKINIATVRRIIREELESVRDVPAGMADPARVFHGNSAAEYNHVNAYVSAGISVPEPGTFGSNNGYIAAVDGSGRVHVYVPGSTEHQKRRSVSPDQMVAALKQRGYREARRSFYVPGSTEGL